VKKTIEVLTTKSSIGISIILILLFVSCARKINFATSQVVPAARGFVKIKKDNNENYLIKMEVSNLAEIERLIPANQTYVVWMVSDDMQPKNIGRLTSSSSLLSSKLKASLETTSTLKPHKIFITTEEIASTQYPGNRIILTTDLF
jgi:hypothetical protein